MSETMTGFQKGFSISDPMREWDAESIFKEGFGEQVVDGQVIYNPRMTKNVEQRPEVKIGKYLAARLEKQKKEGMLTKAGTSIDAGLTGALGTGGAGTAGSALIPVWVDTEITDQTIYDTPLRAMIPRVACRGKTYDFNIITAKGGATWMVEDAALSEHVDTYDRVSVNIKFGYSIGKLTNPAIQAMRGYVDASALDLAVKTQALFELEEDTIINGDVTTYPAEFNGLIQGITTNTTNLSSTNVTLAQIRSEIARTYLARGRVTVGVTDPYTHNYIKGLLMDFQRQPAPPADGLPFGIPGAFQFDSLSVIQSQFMPTTSGSRRFLLLDMRYLVMAVLLDITFQEVVTPTDSRKYMLKTYECFANRYEGAMSQIYGIL